MGGGCGIIRGVIFFVAIFAVVRAAVVGRDGGAMTRLVAALFAVFAVALFVVPAEHAAAQTSPRDCAAENRVAHDSDNTKCGACTTGRWRDGTSCTDAR